MDLMFLIVKDFPSKRSTEIKKPEKSRYKKGEWH